MRASSFRDRTHWISPFRHMSLTLPIRVGAAAWATLFTTDGIYQARGATPAAGNFVQGRDALARFCADAPFDGIHLMHLPHITVDGDTATSRIHLEFVAAFRADGSPTLRMVGFYDVSYVRSASRWLIARRVTTTMFRQDNVAHHYPSTSGLVRCRSTR